MKKVIFERNAEWSGFSVHAAATGWVVESWTRVQGCITGRRWLVPFCPQFPQGMDLDGWWNEASQNGDAIAWIGVGMSTVKVLRRGHTIE